MDFGIQTNIHSNCDSFDCQPMLAPNNTTTTATTTTMSDGCAVAIAFQPQKHRFKVVKLFDSNLNAHYMRGRWSCFDSRTCQTAIDAVVAADNKTATTNAITTVTDASAPKTTPQHATQQNASATNTQTTTATENGVAIDNKIEQAMDLVKSHLMFAVREEVDVLKERIKELESEIQILRAHATQETLQLLERQQQNSSANVNIALNNANVASNAQQSQSVHNNNTNTTLNNNNSSNTCTNQNQSSASNSANE